MENTRDNKARFLLISYANNRNSIKHIHGAGVVFSAIDIINNPDEFYLKLKPLSAISDEDKKEIAKLLGYTGNNIKVEYEENGYRGFMLTAFNGSKKFILLNELPIIVGDYLRSKEYALPFHDLTVQQQIEYGWIKLTNQ